MNYTSQVIIYEELSRGSAAIALSAGAHSNLCSDNINRNGTPEQKEKYLPRVKNFILHINAFLFEHPSFWRKINDLFHLENESNFMHEFLYDNFN